MLMNKFENSKRGVVLVVVLVIFMALSSVTLATIDISSRGAVEAARVRSEYEAHFMAEEALNLVYKMLEDDEEYYSDTPREKWALPWEGDGIRITITPCNARINLNLISQEQSKKLVVQILDALFPGGTNSQKLLGSLANWMGVDSGNKKLKKLDDFYYATQFPSYAAPEATLDTPEEVLLINGWSGFNRDWIDENFTVWGEDDKLNINFASENVLSAYFPKLADRMESIRHWRSTRGFTDISQLISVAGIQSDSNLYQDVVKRLTVRSDYYEAIVAATAQGCTVVKRYIILKPGELSRELPRLVSQTDLKVTFEE